MFIPILMLAESTLWFLLSVGAGKWSTLSILFSSIVLYCSKLAYAGYIRPCEEIFLSYELLLPTILPYEIIYRLS